MLVDQETMSENHAAYDELAKTKAPEQCVHCERDVLFDDMTECWRSRRFGYYCPDAPKGYYGLQAHDV